jgi:hypothetical protein
MAARDAEQEMGFSHQQKIVVCIQNDDFFCAVGNKIGG